MSRTITIDPITRIEGYTWSVLAARRGVRAHHWGFGDMPPVEGVTDADIAAIIAYVRTLQKANGVF